MRAWAPGSGGSGERGLQGAVLAERPWGSLSLSISLLISETGAISVPPWLVPYLHPEASKTDPRRCLLTLERVHPSGCPVMASLPQRSSSSCLFVSKSAKMPVPTPPAPPLLFVSLPPDVQLSSQRTPLGPVGGAACVFSVPRAEHLVEPVKPGMWPWAGNWAESIPPGGLESEAQCRLQVGTQGTAGWQPGLCLPWGGMGPLGFR